MIRNSLEDQPDLTAVCGSTEPSIAATTLSIEDTHGSAAKFTRNAATSIGRLAVTTLVALALPAYLTHKLSSQTYSAWVLILQMSAYVSYLDFGVQSGIAKFVAEYEAKGDSTGANQRASAGFAIMMATSILGVLTTVILAWRVPHFFSQMPAALYRDVRISLLLVGISLSFGLFCSVFSAIFIGLQRYGVPMAIGTLNRVLFAGVVCFSVSRHSSLALMGAAAAAVNVSTGVVQIVAWRKLASRIRVSLYALQYDVLKKMLSYCSVLAIWSAGMLCVSGLDVTIVGRYDFDQTGFYSIATLPTNFIMAILGAALGPLLPATSAMSTQRTSLQMGDVLTKATRYSTILLLITSLPLIVGAYPILRLWIGPQYALHTMGYLRILIAANVLRSLCAPYATMLVATDSQRVAIAGAITEGLVNIVSSIFLAQRFGAIGVAFGTLLGSFVSVLMHFAVSMHFAYKQFALTRASLLMNSMLRPMVISIPSLLLLPLWWKNDAPSFTRPIWVVWIVSTSLCVWFFSLKADERRRLANLRS